MGDAELDLSNMDVKRDRTRALDRTKWHLLWGKPRPNFRGSQWYRRDV